jgi:hypothetical protein
LRSIVPTHPTFVSVDSVHLVDQSSEQTTESTGGGGGGEEQGDSEVDLVSSVPLGEEERNTREQT